MLTWHAKRFHVARRFVFDCAVLFVFAFLDFMSHDELSLLHFILKGVYKF